MMSDILIFIYPWPIVFHILASISWMAGLFYLPRLFVNHAERSVPGDILDETFQAMEYKLLRIIMNPAMIATWVFGILLVLTPGIVDLSQYWVLTKAIAVLAMTWFHHWLACRRKEFEAGQNTLSGRRYRMMNEVPTVLLVIIVVSVIIKF
jgi:protoporphyrinogen IX oxidase